MAKAFGAPGFTLGQLAAFVAVAECGTISAAATRLALSPSAVSGALTELERGLRTDLVRRRKAKGVTLTAAGEMVLPRARNLLHQALDLEVDARDGEGDAGGLLRLGCYPSLSPTLLPALLETFALAHPRARVEVVEDNQNRLLAALAAGDVDVAIGYDIDVDPGWRSVRLASLRPGVVLGGDHRLAGVTGPVDLADLAEDPMVLLDVPPSASHALACCAAAGFAPRVVHHARTYETARAFVGRGFGWTLLLQRPSASVTYEGKALVVRDVGAPPLPQIAVVCLWRRESFLSRVGRAFVAHAVATAERGGLGIPRGN
ncbi:MAG: LysR family transcriptional regulator [Dermatophilaceae bacterium]